MHNTRAVEPSSECAHRLHAAVVAQHGHVSCVGEIPNAESDSYSLFLTLDAPPCAPLLKHSLASRLAQPLPPPSSYITMDSDGPTPDQITKARAKLAARMGGSVRSGAAQLIT